MEIFPRKQLIPEAKYRTPRPTAGGTKDSKVKKENIELPQIGIYDIDPAPDSENAADESDKSNS